MRLDNPVLNRELVENLRSPKAFALQGVFLVLLAAVVLLAWPTEVRLGLKTQIAERVYNTFALGELVLLVLLAPVLSSTAVSGERERKSFDLLLTSPLPPSAIVWGKLLSAVVYLELLAASSLPLFACCLFLGGVGGLAVGAAFFLLFAAAFFSGAVGLAASLWMGRSRAALSVSYVVLLPGVLLLVLLNPLKNPEAASVLGGGALFAGLVLAVLAGRRLRRPFDTAPPSADEEPREEQLGLVLDRRRFPDSLLSARSTGEPLDETRNPVYDKELRHELFGQGTLLMRLLLQGSLIAALPFFIAAAAAKSLWIYSFYVLTFVLLIAPSLAAGMIGQERERATFDLLLTTTLGRSRILGGKLRMAFRSIGLLTLFLLPFYGLLWCLRDVRETVGGFGMTAGTLGTILLAGMFLILLTAFFSLVTRTTLRGMVLTYLAAGILYILPAVLYMVLTTLARLPRESADWIAATSPYFALASFEKEAGGGAPGLSFLPLAATAAARQIWVFWAFALGGSAALAAALWALFDRYARFGHDRGL